MGSGMGTTGQREDTQITPKPVVPKLLFYMTRLVMSMPACRKLMICSTCSVLNSPDRTCPRICATLSIANVFRPSVSVALCLLYTTRFPDVAQALCSSGQVGLCLFRSSHDTRLLCGK